MGLQGQIHSRGCGVAAAEGRWRRTLAMFFEAAAT